MSILACSNALEILKGSVAVFRFFKIAAVRHLGFVSRLFGPPTKRS